MMAEEPTGTDFLTLTKGNERFRKSNKDFQTLVEFQNPEFVVITCSDSRVSPSIILDSPLGTIFEVRTAGEVMDMATLASVEFAVENLDIRKIIVIGHTNCGAVTAAYEIIKGKTPVPNDSSHLASLVKNIFGSIPNTSIDELSLDSCIMANTRMQAKNLLGAQAVRRLFDSGSLSISTALYDLTTGALNNIRVCRPL